MPVVVKGLDEFRRELRRADKRMPKAFQKANKKVSERVVSRGKPAVRGLSSPGGSIAVGGIRPRARQNRATIAFLGSNPTIRATIFGTRSHMVFGRRISGSGPWRPWIGTTWTPEQLYGIGPVIKQTVDRFALDEYLGAVLDALGPAFPD